MSTLEARIAEVIAGHLKRNIKSCDCGWADIGKRHYEHVAQMLAPLIREAQAEAWDVAANCAPEYMPANPYRSNDE